MSSSNRTTSKGGKGAKSDKTHKLDKSDTGMAICNSVKICVLTQFCLGKATGDRQQGGGNENVRSKLDDPLIKEKVKQVIEMTQRDENEVCLVLHECEYDVELAINMLFESDEKVSFQLYICQRYPCLLALHRVRQVTE